MNNVKYPTCWICGKEMCPNSLQLTTAEYYKPVIISYRCPSIHETKKGLTVTMILTNGSKTK